MVSAIEESKQLSTITTEELKSSVQANVRRTKQNPNTAEENIDQDLQSRLTIKED